MTDIGESAAILPEDEDSKEPKTSKLEVAKQRLSGAKVRMTGAVQNVSWRGVGLVAGGVAALAVVGAVVLKKRRG